MSDPIDNEYSAITADAGQLKVDWSVAAVRLLQGVVYHDENARVWDSLLRFISPLTEYFTKIGLELIVDEADGMAYLRQTGDEHSDSDQTAIPRLFRRTALGYEASLLCVLLRDFLRQFEEDDLQNERCVVSHDELLRLWSAFFTSTNDQVKLNRSLISALRRLEELKFVRQFEDDPMSWEIKRVLKARLGVDDLERLKHSLLEHLANQNRGANIDAE